MVVGVDVVGVVVVVVGVVVVVVGRVVVVGVLVVGIGNDGLMVGLVFSNFCLRHAIS